MLCDCAYEFSHCLQALDCLMRELASFEEFGGFCSNVLAMQASEKAVADLAAKVGGTNMTSE